MPKLTDDQRSRVLHLVRAGRGRNQIARETGVSAGSVSAIAKAEGLAITPAGIDRSRLKELMESAEAFQHQRRLRIYAKAAAAAERRLDLVLAGEDSITPRALQALVTSVAIAHEKTRLELGESTHTVPRPAPGVIWYTVDNGRRRLVAPERRDTQEGSRP